ncbi:MAG: terminase small subunit, partial [Stellaceae bacterium]
MHLRIQQFVREYLVDLNAAAAARRSGYPARSATTRGNKLMARRDVQEAVKQAMAARAARTGVTADRVVLEYARIAFADMPRQHVERAHLVVQAQAIAAPARAGADDLRHRRGGIVV